MHSDRRTLAGRAAAPRGNRMQVSLALDHRLLDQLDEAARLRSTSRVALIAAWLSEKLGQETADPRELR
jgi:hypothetical protein